MKTVSICGVPCEVATWWYHWVTHVAHVDRLAVARDQALFKSGVPADELPTRSEYWRKRYPEPETIDA